MAATPAACCAREPPQPRSMAAAGAGAASAGLPDAPLATLARRRVCVPLSPPPSERKRSTSRRAVDFASGCEACDYHGQNQPDSHLHFALTVPKIDPSAAEAGRHRCTLRTVQGCHGRLQSEHRM